MSAEVVEPSPEIMGKPDVAVRSPGKAPGITDSRGVGITPWLCRIVASIPALVSTVILPFEGVFPVVKLARRSRFDEILVSCRGSVKMPAREDVFCVPSC